MQNQAYQKSAKDEGCTFAHLGGCSGDIVHHHIRVAGMCGTGLKMGDEFTIPVCQNTHHPLCDSRKIKTAEQLEEMVTYWMCRLVKLHGVVPALEMMGDAYGKMIQGEYHE